MASKKAVDYRGLSFPGPPPPPRRKPLTFEGIPAGAYFRFANGGQIIWTKLSDDFATCTIGITPMCGCEKIIIQE